MAYKYRYNTSTDVTGKDGTIVEKLHSILAQLEYKYQIDMWNDKGVLFKEQLYVPKIHPETQLRVL